VVLWIPEGADAAAAQVLRKTTAELSSSAGMDLAEVASLTPEEMKPHMRYVVALQPADAAGLASAFAESRFVLVTTEDTSPAQNLTVIRMPVLQQAFLAGYLAAMSADQWKTGMLSRSDTPAGAQIRDAFINGVRYLCGNCAPRYDPKLPLNYPVYADATPGAFQAGLDSLVAQGVQVMYVDPGLETGEVDAAAGQAALHMITGKPAPENNEGPGGLLIARVLMSVDEALREVWPDLIDGTPGRSITAPLVITEVNNNFISSARMRLVEETRLQLEEGWIFPGQPVEKVGSE
jgi:basic membrane lipoprotein Med (substrate-binding protein (PBP1-ABC) superfamily)